MDLNEVEQLYRLLAVHLWLYTSAGCFAVLSLVVDWNTRNDDNLINWGAMNPMVMAVCYVWPNCDHEEEDSLLYIVLLYKKWSPSHQRLRTVYYNRIYLIH